MKKERLTSSNKERTGPGIRTGKVPDELNGCRCKEAKGKTFPELLKLMLRDLAVWKRTGRE